MVAKDLQILPAFHHLENQVFLQIQEQQEVNQVPEEGLSPQAEGHLRYYLQKRGALANCLLLVHLL